MRRDLKRAGVQVRTADGKLLDFHALRATFGTLLANENVPLTLAQTLLRHSDPKLTANVYTKHRLVDEAAAVERIRLGAGLRGLWGRERDNKGLAGSKTQVEQPTSEPTETPATVVAAGASFNSGNGT